VRLSGKPTKAPTRSIPTGSISSGIAAELTDTTARCSLVPHTRGRDLSASSPTLSSVVQPPAKALASARSDAITSRAARSSCSRFGITARCCPGP
jgi:hypothetical protein